MLREWYMHPNGQMPAYEWNFGDVNPPVHAWATMARLQDRLEKRPPARATGTGSSALPQAAAELHLVGQSQGPHAGATCSRAGSSGSTTSACSTARPLPTGGYLEQSDGTAWMGMFCQNMLQIALELATTTATTTDMALQVRRALPVDRVAMTHVGGETGMWDEEDGFFYDVLRSRTGGPSGSRSGPWSACCRCAPPPSFEGQLRPSYPELRRAAAVVPRLPPRTPRVHPRPGQARRRRPPARAILDAAKLRRVLAKMLDENEFLSPYGIRSLSRHHEAHPFVMHAGGQEYRVGYQPAESDTGLFGGNSNWRGPIWLPVNASSIRGAAALLHVLRRRLHRGVPDRVRAAHEPVPGRRGDRAGGSRIFLRGADGRRPVYGGTEKFQTDPHWKDLVLFYEYFHGDNGAGLGASHQTGWTGVVARLMHLFATTSAEQLAQSGRVAALTVGHKPRTDQPAEMAAGHAT
jgi:hypothetical protein